MEYLSIYNDYIPGFISDIAAAPEMQRLKKVGMDCGCEYTSFEIFKKIIPCSRYVHSIGAALITWHFSEDEKATIAALLHDIASPVFAHTVDFLNGDYETQESTEDGTALIIRSSKEIVSCLSGLKIKPEEVSDYHMYPIADNNSPRLSADRLEYTLSNGINFNICLADDAARMYRDLCVTKNEDNEDEIAFTTIDVAEEFTYLSLQCSYIYVSPEDRFAMQKLADVLKYGIECGVISRKDLYGTEDDVITKLVNSIDTSVVWNRFRALSKMVPPDEKPGEARVISSKKRYIDPLVKDKGRISSISEGCRDSIEKFLSQDFSIPVAGI